VAKSTGEGKTEKKVGQNRLFRYFRETYYELKRVSWPTRSEGLNLTVIVVAVTTFMSIVLGLIDYVFSLGFGLLP
jgi:preprotein translocase SecE subunit